MRECSYKPRRVISCFSASIAESELVLYETRLEGQEIQTWNVTSATGQWYWAS